MNTRIYIRRLQGRIMPFEVFGKKMAPLAKGPNVTTQKRSQIWLKKTACKLVDSAVTMELLYDRDRQVMGVRVADISS
jgi:hypothetical protein